MPSFPKLVGILNLTPDSFSDGGKYNSKEELIIILDKLVNQGADIVDVGAESTRPGATPLTWQEEWQRLDKKLPFILNYCHSKQVKVSLDSRHPQTLHKAISMGIDIINDQSGGSNDKMIEEFIGCDLPIVIMHNLGIPSSKSITLPNNCDPIEEIIIWANNQLSYLENKGVDRNRIIIDPGIGFGKTAEQSINIMNNISKLGSIGLPIYVGHSRKSFLEKMTDAKAENRDHETLIVSMSLAKQNVDYLRVHNVGIHKKAFSS